MEEMTSGATGTADPGVVTTATGESPAPTTSGTTSAPSEQSFGGATTGSVQGESTTTESDPLAGVLSLDDINKLPDDSQYKKSLVQMRTAIEQTFKPQLTEFQEKFKTVEPFQPTLERFERPEQLQQVVGIFEGLTGWERDASGELVPATEKGIQQYAELYPQHADFAAADLLNMETVDPNTGRRATRMNLALEGIAKDPTRRAEALQILGAVEPSSISPQWQPSEEELSIVRDDLKDTYKKLPYEDREELKLASPEFINKTLADRKLMDELRQDREQSQQREQERVQQREQYLNQQAQQAGDQHVSKLMTDALTTFHNSVVEQCNFLQPIDPQNLPQGMTAEQATQMNQQIAASNKAEAAQITAMIVNLVNEETRPFVVPLLKEIGVIDDKFLEQLDKAAQGFGDNARNYGHLSFRGQLQANGNGYQPGQDVTMLNNEAQRNLKLLVHYANQVKGKLMERRSQFFGMKAQGHNQTLNSTAVARPSPNGTTFNPATATNAQPPAGKLSRAQIDAMYG